MTNQKNERDAFLSLLRTELGETTTPPEWDDYRTHYLDGSTEHLPLAKMICVIRGEADEKTTGEVQQHLAVCDHCKEWFDAYQRGWNEPPDADAVSDSLLAEVSRGLKANKIAPPISSPVQGKEGSDYTLVGGTIQAQSLETWPTLKERFKPWLPALLSLAGVNPNRSEEFLGFIEKNHLIPIGKDEHLRQVLPGWLKKFANTTLDELSDDNLKWMALRVVAGREAAGESPEAKLARETLLTSREVVTREDIKQLTQTGAMPPLPDAYWSMFFKEVRREEHTLAGLL